MPYLFLLPLLGMFLSPSPAAPPPHEYHISKTNLRYVTAQRAVQIEMHLFVDDVEAAMREAGAPELFLGDALERADAPDYLKRYLDKHFRIDWNGAPLTLDLVGYELEDDLHGLWVYLLAPEREAPQEIRVQNTLLTEHFDDQKNITKLFSDTDRLATLLTSKERTTADYVLP